MPLASSSVKKTLRPCKEESLDFDKTEIYIEGDNLDVLKLLCETYLGKVKMIYIAPPYLTVAFVVYSVCQLLFSLFQKLFREFRVFRMVEKGE